MRIQHTDTCTTSAWGRAVRDLAAPSIRLGEDRSLWLSDVIAYASSIQAAGCDCGKLELGRIENELRLARKTQRSIAATSQPSSATYNLCAERIASLVAVRDELRAELEGHPMTTDQAAFDTDEDRFGPQEKTTVSHAALMNLHQLHATLGVICQETRERLGTGYLHTAEYLTASVAMNAVYTALDALDARDAVLEQQEATR